VKYISNHISKPKADRAIHNVKLSLCLTKHHSMKAYWEWRYSATHSWVRH